TGRVPSSIDRQARKGDEPCTSAKMRSPAPASTESQACPTLRTISSNGSLSETETAAAEASGPTRPSAAAGRHSPLPPWVTMTSPTRGLLSGAGAIGIFSVHPFPAGQAASSRTAASLPRAAALDPELPRPAIALRRAAALDVAVPDRDRKRP